MVWVEANFVVERENRRMANEAILLQMAVSSLFSEKGRQRFDRETKRLAPKD